jgi:hypothetical protein
MKNWIYSYSTGFLNLNKYPYKQRYIAGSAKCETSFQIINICSIRGRNRASVLVSM